MQKEKEKSVPPRLASRVARFFVAQHTKTGTNIPKLGENTINVPKMAEKIYKMAKKIYQIAGEFIKWR
jgi:hypothetical protein